MDVLREFLADVKRHGYARGNLLGMLHLSIGRQIKAADGAILSRGLTRRELADLLKKARWNPDAVLELGLDPAALPPRDRQRYWYQVIAQVRVDSAQATEAGDRLAQVLNSAGYQIGTAPGTVS